MCMCVCVCVYVCVYTIHILLEQIQVDWWQQWPGREAGLRTMGYIA